jgi:hypothetical protein
MILTFVVLFQKQWLIGKENGQFEQTRYYVAPENICICEEGFLILGGEILFLVNEEGVT